MWHGTVAWSNASNASGAQDGTLATATTAAQSLDALKLYNFGFSIPTGAIISAALYEAYMKCLIGTPGTWNLAAIVFGETAQLGPDMAISVPTTIGWLTGNGSGAGIPTVAYANNSNYGFAPYNTGSPTDTFSVDAGRITLTYTLPAGDFARPFGRRGANLMQSLLSQARRLVLPEGTIRLPGISIVDGEPVYTFQQTRSSKLWLPAA